MRPEDVPLHLVRIALAAIPRDQFGAKADWMRHALAAVLPLAVAEEREACAKVAEALLADNLTGSRNPLLVVQEIATAIRSRGEPQ